MTHFLLCEFHLNLKKLCGKRTLSPLYFKWKPNFWEPKWGSCLSVQAHRSICLSQTSQALQIPCYFLPESFCLCSYVAGHLSSKPQLTWDPVRDLPWPVCNRHHLTSFSLPHDPIYFLHDTHHTLQWFVSLFVRNLSPQLKCMILKTEPFLLSAVNLLFLMHSA